MADSSLEISFTLQHVEENGRKRGDPWSLRQTGVYQQVDFKAGTSVWIILQPSDYVRKSLEHALVEKSYGACGQESSPMLLHVLFILAAADNWTRYIRDLESEAKDLVGAASSHRFSTRMPVIICF